MQITYDPKIPSNSFRFMNSSKEPINVVISCATNNSGYLPIHITSEPVAPNMEMNFTPLAKVVVWVQYKIVTSTMYAPTLIPTASGASPRTAS